MASNRSISASLSSGPMPLTFEVIRRKSSAPKSVIVSSPKALRTKSFTARSGSAAGVTTIVTNSEREAMNLACLELPDCFVVHQNLMEGGHDPG